MLEKESTPIKTNNPAPIQRNHSVKNIQDIINNTEKTEIESNGKKQYENIVTTFKNKQERGITTKPYEDPTDGTCVHSRGTCREDENCFLGYGYYDYNACLNKADTIQANITKYNIKHMDDGKKLRDVKYISWSGPNSTMKEPQCFIMDDRAIISTEDEGWKTVVRNPKHFTMTENPSIYMVEDTCPVLKA